MPRTSWKFTSVPERKLRALRQNAGTVYRQLLAQGFTPEGIEAEATDSAELRRIALISARQDGTDVPLIGVAYGGDFRAEEEYGLPQIRKALRDGDGARRVFTGEVEGRFYLGVHADAGLTSWHQDELIARRAGEAQARARREAEWRRGYEDDRKTVHQLRAGLREAGVEGSLPRTKQELRDLHCRHVRGGVPFLGVGEFHMGDTLIMLPATPVLEAALRILATSGKHLRMGGSGSPFSRSATLFDDRDLTGDTIEATRAHEDYIRRMDQKAEPIRQELRKHGFLYALNPGRRQNGKDLFWLNYSLRDPSFKQQWGWFTLPQLAELIRSNGWERRGAA